MSLSLLDSDILTEVFKRRNQRVALHAAAYLQSYGQFAFSSMSRYEVIRGLRYKRATGLMKRFSALETQSIVFPISDAVLDRAADLWVEGRRIGKSHRDADLIIAATALVQSRTLVTGNTSHFDWIAGLTIANWREP